jgi:acyl-coenzyme A synthetase/AMP-(fatty) acid ligase
MERHPTGLLAITPIQLREVLLALPAGFELKSGWRVVVSGAAMTPALARTARSRLTPDIIISYGATESGRACVGPASLLEANPGAIGWPVPGAVGRGRGAGRPGAAGGRTGRDPGQERADQLELRGQSGGLGEDLPRRLRLSGDLGRRLADGSFVVTGGGRADQRPGPEGAARCAGERPGRPPQVGDCAAFAMPGADGGEECWMAVVSDGEVERESLMAALTRAGIRLPPIRFAWTAEIPRSEMGKIDRGRAAGADPGGVGEGRGLTPLLDDREAALVEEAQTCSRS